MASEWLIVKNWEKFQHYKKRNPPWIRFYRSTLIDHELAVLSIESRLLANLLWLLASENNGQIKHDASMISFRVSLPKDIVEKGVVELLDAGFLRLKNDDASMLEQTCANSSHSALSVSVKEGITSELGDRGLGEGDKSVFSELPDSLDTANFRELWLSWEKHLADNNRRIGLMQRPMAWHELIAKTPHGHHPVTYASEVLRRCMANGWKTLVHHDSNGKGKPEPPKRVYKDYTAERLAQAKKETA